MSLLFPKDPKDELTFSQLQEYEKINRLSPTLAQDYLHLHNRIKLVETSQPTTIPSVDFGFNKQPLVLQQEHDKINHFSPTLAMDFMNLNNKIKAAEDLEQNQKANINRLLRKF